MVGEEPYCEVTRAYNESLEKILKNYHVEVEIIKRKKNEAEVISASRVRSSIRVNKRLLWEELAKLLPKVTLEYLESEEGRKIVKKIMETDSRH